MGCFSALVRLKSLSLSHMQLTGLPLVAQACSALTQLKLRHMSLPPDLLQPLLSTCTWPFLVELCFYGLEAGVLSTAFSIAESAPN